jgi:hypothetical protein
MVLDNRTAFATQGVFSNNQPVYAEHGVATFPLKDDKVSAIKHYSHVCLAGSAKLARKFTDASALGFIAGRRSKIAFSTLTLRRNAAVCSRVRASWPLGWTTRYKPLASPSGISRRSLPGR